MPAARVPTKISLQIISMTLLFVHSKNSEGKTKQVKITLKSKGERWGRNGLTSKNLFPKKRKTDVTVAAKDIFLMT